MPEVTVAIPTFRRPKGLERLLLAIDRLETDATLRILVADNDAERRDGIAVVEQRKAPACRWPVEAFVVVERGIAQARNALVERALAVGFDYLAMLDDDEWPEEGWLDGFLNVAVETGADALHGQVLPEFEIAPGRWSKHCHGFAPLRRTTGAIAMIHGTGNVLLRRAAFDMLSPPWFDIQFALSGGEDKDFFTRLKMAGARFAWADEAVIHTDVPASRSNPRWALQRAFRVGNSDMRVFIKHNGALCPRIVQYAKIFGALVLSPFLTLLAAPLSELRMLSACKLARALGKLAALCGLRYNEYAVVHGQ